MAQIRGAVRYVLVAGSVLLALFVVTQVAQLVALASTVHPLFGSIIAVLLVLGLGALVVVPALAYLRLEPPLAPPVETSGPEHEAFVRRYLQACRRNPLLSGMTLETEEDLETALKVLEAEAENVARQTASRVFLGTAVSQFGALDTLVVALTQASMVWRIAHVFQRRPSLRHVGYLFANVLATAATSSQLERIDLSRHLQPLLGSLLGQSIASMPGVAAASGFVSNSLFQGTVNAFLTLRVAMVTIEYSRATVRPVRATVWKSAVARAAKLLARTVASGTTRVTRAFVVAAGRSVVGAAGEVASAVARGGRHVGSGVVRAAGAVGSAAAQAGSAVSRPVRRLGRRKAEPGASVDDDGEEK